MLNILAFEIHAVDVSLNFCFIMFGRVLEKKAFNLFGDFRGRGSAVFELEFYAIVDRRVVARGDDDAAACSAVFD